MNELYIQNIMNNLKSLDMAKQELDKEIKKYEHEIISYMTQYDLEEIVGVNGEKAINKEILARRFGTKNFKKNFSDLYDSYMKDVKSFRFKFSY